MAKIMIIGGHGKVALLAAPLLVQAGHEVTSVFRNPEHEADVAATGAITRVVDLESLDADGFAELVAGQQAIVWSAGAGGGNPERTYAVDRDAAIASMQGALQAGVNRYIMVSYAGAGVDHGVDPGSSFFAYAEAKAAADEALRGSGLGWTILGPSRLTLDEASGMIEVGVSNDGGQVSRANVARVIKAVIAEPATIGRRINFNDGSTPIAQAILA
ncbi:NAD(P)-dependent oxidoreductase [Propionibacteriaceae bacterium G57]|uniref:NAD(P)-dependent oxidoreductase n=1 Tax=Aestuariimicrobium sp. G57 TaxID=3418485 RepID=UPI003DA78C75